MSRRIVLASANSGKLTELQALLAPLRIELVAQAALGVSPVEETGASFAENAALKASHAASQTGLPAIADDSGLEVDALGGAPGVHSARYAGQPTDDRRNNERLLRELQDVPDARRTARFRCVIAYLSPPAPPSLHTASWEGRIALVPKGTGGFGYDSLFYLPGHGCSSAELSPEQKNRLSHRGRAVQSLLRTLNGGV